MFVVRLSQLSFLLMLIGIFSASTVYAETVAVKLRELKVIETQDRNLIGGDARDEIYFITIAKVEGGDEYISWLPTDRSYFGVKRNETISSHCLFAMDTPDGAHVGVVTLIMEQSEHVPEFSNRNLPKDFGELKNKLRNKEGVFEEISGMVPSANDEHIKNHDLIGAVAFDYRVNGGMEEVHAHNIYGAIGQGRIVAAGRPYPEEWLIKAPGPPTAKYIVQIGISERNSRWEYGPYCPAVR